MPQPNDDSDDGVHELIIKRRSSRAFDPRALRSADLDAVLEAARWAPSSYNEQPWRFIVADRRNETDFSRMLDCLVPANHIWAERAPILIASAAALTFERNAKPNRHALHDVGLAVSQLTMEATVRGLNVHQMAGFYADTARAVYSIPAEYELVAVMALGYRGAVESLPAELQAREQQPRTRKRREDLVFAETWGKSLPTERAG